jgi:hypothetical protein
MKIKKNDKSIEQDKKVETSGAIAENSFSVPCNIVDDELSVKLESLYQRGSLNPSGYLYLDNPLHNKNEDKNINMDNLCSQVSYEEVLNFAEQGIAQAQNDLGIMYLTGNGVEIDASKAVYWLWLASKQGEPNATANLGRCSLEGIGVKKNTAHAVMLFGWACIMGIENITKYIIETIDINELIELSEQGNAKAQYFLGVCYAHGVNVEKNEKKVFEWFYKSAEQNEPLALLFLGRCLSNGIGFEKDLLQAEYILKKAAKYAAKEVGRLGIMHVDKEITVVRDSIIDNCPYVLVKVIPTCKEDGKKEDKYVNDFLDGKLFMKTLDQFSDLEKRDSSSDNNFRGDILEGFSESFGIGYNPHLYKSDKDGNIEKDGMLGSIDALKLREKVFCLTAIEYDEKHHSFIKPDSRMKEFGEYAVIITDVEEFLRRVSIKFKDLCKKNDANYWMAYNRVKYGIDLSQLFQYNEFRKSESYLWQKEFRIIIDFSEGRFSSEILDNVTDFVKFTFRGKIEKDTDSLSLANQIYFEIGDIRDICVCLTSEELVNSDKVQFTFNKKPMWIDPLYSKRELRPTFCKGVREIQREDGSFSLTLSKKYFFSAVL